MSQLDLEVKSLFADVGGVRMRYERVGQGHPLLLLHGLIGSPGNWHRNVPSLAAISDVIALDLFDVEGVGSVLQVDRGLEATADRVCRFLDVIGVERVDIAGHSRGGALTLMIAARHPARVRRLIVFAPANPFCNDARHLIEFYSSWAGGLVAGVIPILPKFVKKLALRRMYGDPSRILPGSLERYMAVLALPGAIRHILQILRGWKRDMDTLRTHLASAAHKPVLMIWGDRDRAVGVSSAVELQRVLPEAKLLVLPGVGHIPFEEMPAPCNKAMRDWLEAPEHELRKGKIAVDPSAPDLSLA